MTWISQSKSRDLCLLDENGWNSMISGEIILFLLRGKFRFGYRLRYGRYMGMNRDCWSLWRGRGMDRKSRGMLMVCWGGYWAKKLGEAELHIARETLEQLI